MLDFLKTVLGDAYTDEIDKAISEEIGKGFVARADFNTLKDSKKGLEEQLKTANETISGFKNLDIEGVKAEAEKYRIAAEQAEKDAAEKIAGQAKDHVQAFGVRVSERRILQPQNRGAMPRKPAIHMAAGRPARSQSLRDRPLSQRQNNTARH